MNFITERKEYIEIKVIEPLKNRQWVAYAGECEDSAKEAEKRISVALEIVDVLGHERVEFDDLRVTYEVLESNYY